MKMQILQSGENSAMKVKMNQRERLGFQLQEIQVKAHPEKEKPSQQPICL